MTAAPPLPDFGSRAFLTAHLARLIDFHHARVLDPRGGYFQYFALDGSLVRRDERSLVSSARMVVSFCMAARALDRPELLEAARHGLEFLLRSHRDPRHGGYAWSLRADGSRFVPVDAGNHAYGLAHVGLACAHATAAGLPGARAALDGIFDRMERHALDRGTSLYTEEFEPDWTPRSEYRGQNANMHACEAWLAAHWATGEARFLARAAGIAQALCVTSARDTHDLVYEHFDPRWRADFRYNEGDFSNPYRAWGFQVGHQTEWAKFLLRLARANGDARIAGRARELFVRAVELGWDDAHGGLVYGLAPDLTVCNTDKYFWVQIESAVAARKLAAHFGDPAFERWHQRLWTVCWQRFVDHADGSWHRQWTRDFSPMVADKGSAGKDYHVIGACFDLLGFDEESAAVPGTPGSRLPTTDRKPVPP